MIPAWRISDPEFAQTPDEMLSGEGARLYGGRWNREGRLLIYASGNIATATLEILVNLEERSILRSYMMINMLIPDEIVLEVEQKDLPDEWREDSMTPITQAIGDNWLQSGESAVLKVPSVAAPMEWNYLINPDHPDFEQIEIQMFVPYNMDPRLGNT